MSGKTLSQQLSDIEIAELEKEVAPMIAEAEALAVAMIDEMKIPEKIGSLETFKDSRIDYYKDEAIYHYLLRRLIDARESFEKIPRVKELRERLKVLHIQFGLDPKVDMPVYLDRTMPRIHPKGKTATEYNAVQEELDKIEKDFANALAPLENRVSNLKEELSQVGIRVEEDREWKTLPKA